jgi:hypothetical protein
MADPETPNNDSRLIDQITPSFKRGGRGKLFRNVGIGITATFLAACVPGVVAAASVAEVAGVVFSTGGAFLEPVFNAISGILSLDASAVLGGTENSLLLEPS